MKSINESERVVSAARVAEVLPEFFQNRDTVVRWAQRRLIPCLVVPAGTRRRVRYLFRIAEVKRAMKQYEQKEVSL